MGHLCQWGGPDEIVHAGKLLRWTEAWSVAGCWEKGHAGLGPWKQQHSVLAEGGVQSESSFSQYPSP